MKNNFINIQILSKPTAVASSRSNIYFDLASSHHRFILLEGFNETISCVELNIAVPFKFAGILIIQKSNFLHLRFDKSDVRQPGKSVNLSRKLVVNNIDCMVLI